MARLNPRERLLKRGVGQAEICMQHCGAKCCRYLTVSIPTPTAETDWDEIRWWLAHEEVWVTKDDEGWLLTVEMRCRHLEANGACGIYESRMNLCAKHDAADCEFAVPLANEVELRNESDLADYLERRRLKRGRRVAESIRKAEALSKRSALRPAAPAFVQIQPLPETR
jgi:hypothetical protein